MRLRPTLGWLAVSVALGVTFAAYLRPDMAFSLATQLWNCL